MFLVGWEVNVRLKGMNGKEGLLGDGVAKGVCELAVTVFAYVVWVFRFEQESYSK